jgi:hypothetical protein
MEVVMRKWTIWKMVVAIGIIGSASAPQVAVAQGSGSVGTSEPLTGEPVASPLTNVTSAMLREAAQSGDWLLYGHN